MPAATSERQQADSGLRRLFRALADLVFPPRCLGCGEPLSATLHPLFCASCLDGLPWIAHPFCPRCGRPFAAGADRLCGECLVRPPAFHLARSLFFYKGPVRDGILGLKFRGERDWLPTLPALCRRSPLLADFGEPDLVIPAPLHPSRLRERGCNQSLLLARRCFPEWRDRIDPLLLLRTRPTVPQSTLDGAARRRNLLDAFAVAEGAAFAGKKVLLVDDVFTTGTTVAACSEALARAGALRVEVFTLARSIRL